MHCSGGGGVAWVHLTPLHHHIATSATFCSSGMHTLGPNVDHTWQFVISYILHNRVPLNAHSASSSNPYILIWYGGKFHPGEQKTLTYFRSQGSKVKAVIELYELSLVT